MEICALVCEISLKMIWGDGRSLGCVQVVAIGGAWRGVDVVDSILSMELSDGVREAWMYLVVSWW